MPLNELIEKVISNNLSLVNNMDDYHTLTKILRAVAEKMTTKDEALMVAEDNEDPMLRKYKIHPNFISRFD